jgi:chromosome segregation ATPase
LFGTRSGGAHVEEAKHAADGEPDDIDRDELIAACEALVHHGTARRDFGSAVAQRAEPFDDQPDQREPDQSAESGRLEPSQPVDDLVEQLELARRDVEDYRSALAASEEQLAVLRTELESARSDDLGVTQVDRGTDERVTALTRELENAQAVIAESATEFEYVVAELRDARAHADDLAAERDRLAAELAERARTESEALAEVVTERDRLAAELADHTRAESEVAALRRAIDEQRQAFEIELARARDSEARHAFAADEIGAALLARQAEIDSLQQRLLTSEQQRAEEAASLLALLENEVRGAPETVGRLD